MFQALILFHKPMIRKRIRAASEEIFDLWKILFHFWLLDVWLQPQLNEFNRRIRTLDSTVRFLTQIILNFSVTIWLFHTFSLSDSKSRIQIFNRTDFNLKCLILKFDPFLREFWFYSHNLSTLWCIFTFYSYFTCFLYHVASELLLKYWNPFYMSDWKISFFIHLTETSASLAWIFTHSSFACGTDLPSQLTWCVTSPVDLRMLTTSNCNVMLQEFCSSTKCCTDTWIRKNKIKKQ